MNMQAFESLNAESSGKGGRFLVQNKEDPLQKEYGFVKITDFMAKKISLRQKIMILSVFI